jgi:peptidyl-prolyl cis-trans isomerase C
MFPGASKGFLSLLLVFIAATALAGCGIVKERLSTSTVTPTVAQASPTPLAPTPTPEPLAVKVNDGGVSINQYQAELKLYQESETETGKTPIPADDAKTVMDSLIDDTLLAQAAVQGGYKVDDATLQAHLDQLSKEMTNGATLKDWENKYGYTDASFRVALKQSMLAAWQRDQIINAVPETADQVNARQILVLDATLADKIYQQLQTGGDFAALAKLYDPELGGNLGWFPRGFLTQPEIEDAAFNLQPGKYSTVIQTAFGYQIVQCIARDAKHPLSPEARRVLQGKALADWMKQKVSQSKIEVLVSTG